MARTIPQHVAERCRHCPDKPLLEFEDGLSVSRAEFLDLVEQFAGYLQQRIKPGDRVGLCLGTRAEYMVALVAIVACRGIVISINPDAKEHDAGHIIADATPVLLIVQPENRQLFEEIAQRVVDIIEVLCIDPDEPKGMLQAPDGTERFKLENASCQPEETVAVYYTSGTTGTPKGCMVNHLWWLRLVDVDLRLNPDGRDRALCSVPFYYADPAFYVLVAFQVGGTVIVMRHFSVSRYWDVVHDFRVTKIHAIASIPVLLVKAPPHSKERDHRVHHATCVAVPANLHRQLVERFGFPWIDNYGSSECGHMARVPWSMHDELIGSGSVGVESPEVEIRVVDEGEQDVGVDMPGEAVVRAPHMFSGYYMQPAATADVLRDGWYYTGDLVRRDSRGLIYFLGRKKDVVRRSGQNISTAEVESVLRLLPLVKDAAVIPVPDEIRGEEAKAYVLLTDGASPEDLPPSEIIQFCQKHLAGYKVPRYLEYRFGAFPRTASMRVKKEELKTERASLTDGAWDRDKEFGRIRA